MKKIRFTQSVYGLFLGTVFLGIGFLGQLYYLTHQAQLTRHLYSTVEIRRARAISHQLHEVEYRNAHLEAQIAELGLPASALWNNGQSNEFNGLGKLLGLSEQRGSGIELVLKDSGKPFLLGDNPNVGVIHNTDLAQLVNELREAGAISVSINKQPITAMTGINCSGPVITVNGSRMASPFVIQALGDNQKMMLYLARPKSYIQELKKYDIDVAVTPKTITIPASSQNI